MKASLKFVKWGQIFFNVGTSSADLQETSILTVIGEDSQSSSWGYIEGDSLQLDVARNKPSCRDSASRLAVLKISKPVFNLECMCRPVWIREYKTY